MRQRKPLAMSGPPGRLAPRRFECDRGFATESLVGERLGRVEDAVEKRVVNSDEGRRVREVSSHFSHHDRTWTKRQYTRHRSAASMVATTAP